MCTAASTLGGLAGYGIGYFLFETWGKPILALYGYEESFAHFATLYNAWGILIVLVAGFTPIPYKIVTIASGLTGLNLVTFLLASLISRGARFFLVAGLLYYFGETIRNFIERYLGALSLGFVALLIGGFVVIKFMKLFIPMVVNTWMSCIRSKILRRPPYKRTIFFYF